MHKTSCLVGSNDGDKKAGDGSSSCWKEDVHLKIVEDVIKDTARTGGGRQGVICQNTKVAHWLLHLVCFI